MFGDSILVAPKVTEPNYYRAARHQQKVNYYLPATETWYSLMNDSYGEAVDSSELGVWQTVHLQDTDEAAFVKAGSIIPILNHFYCMSLMSCINNDITIEIYLDENLNAEGTMYLDDYETFDYVKNEDYARLAFHCNSTDGFSVENVNGNERGDNVVINSILIYGMPANGRPDSVRVGG